MLQKKNKFLIFLLSLFLCFVFLCPIFSTRIIKAETEVDSFSSVLDDLSKSDNFNPDDFPFVQDNYSLEVIGLSESDKYEFFVYVYVPSGDELNITATSINISQEHKALKFDNYFLSLISRDGVFHKYLVKDFTVKYDSVRYYEISSIFRKYNEIFGDTTSSETNTTSEFGIKVGKSYRHTDNTNGGYDVYVEDLDLITITDRYVGFVRYKGGIGIGAYYEVDFHFIAFSTDKQLDQLLESDLIYTSMGYTESSFLGKITPTYKSPVVNKFYANYKEDLIYDEGWFSPKYKFKQIETATDFLKTESKGQTYSYGFIDVTQKVVLKDTAKSDIESKDWVIRFAVTDILTTDTESGYCRESTTIISDVSILRLAYKTDGKFYNMGVVDNKTSSNGEPSNDPSQSTTEITVNLDKLEDYLKILLGVFFLFIIIFVLNSTGIFNIIIKFIGFIIALPFKFLKWLIDKFRGK